MKLNKIQPTNQSLEAKHEQLKDEFKLKAKSFGKRGLPRLNDSITTFISPIKAGYENAAKRYVQRPTEGDRKIATLEKEKLIKRQEELNELLPKQQNEQIRAEEEKEQRPVETNNTKRGYAILTHCVIFVLALFESLITKRAMSFFDNSSNFAQSLILIGLMGMYVLLPHGLIWVYQNNQTNRYRYVIWGGVGVTIIAGFYALALLRSMAIKHAALSTLETSNNIVLSIHPIYYMIVQLLFLLGEVYAASLLPTDQQLADQKKTKEVKQKINSAQARIEEIQEELESIPEKIHQLEVALNEKANQADEMEALIESYYHECWNEFVTENLMWNDNRPTCFDQPIPPLFSGKGEPRPAAAIIIGAMLIASLSSCEHNPLITSPHTTAIGAVVDISDTGITYLKPSEVVSLYNFKDEHLYDGYSYRRVCASDVENKEIVQYRVKPTNWVSTDRNERVAEIKDFQANVKTDLSVVSNQFTLPSKQSLIFEAICKELQALKETYAEKKILIVYSDLLENSEIFSFYNKADAEIALKTPLALLLRFQKMASIPNLDGVTIYVIYRPRSHSEQLLFNSSVEIMGTIFRRAGAKFIVAPNILINE